VLELTTYEGKKRSKGAAALAVLFAVLAVLYTGTFPSVVEGMAPGTFDQLVSSYPDAMVEALNLQSLTTIEGYLASQLYTVGWILLGGLYFGYAGAGLIADDVDRGRMDILLFLPLSRARLVAEKFASLLVPLVAINVITPLVVYISAEVIGYPVDALNVVMMHLLSIPYLLCCAAIGLVFSVLVDRASIAQRGVLGVLFGLFLLESVVVGTDFELVRNIVPMHYLDPTAILLNSEYDLVAAGILLAATIVLVVASQAWFTRKDVA
jgi:ABC-2 type transport system permease protein